MKIAQVTPLYEAVPPRLYGGAERVVAHLTDALVDLGHDVTLFASVDAETRARLIPVRDQAIRLDPAPFKSDLAAHLVMLSEVMKRADDFDVIHFHTDMIHFPMFERFADRTLTTLHGRLDMKDIGGVYERWPQFGLVSISDDRRRPLPFANWKATVHHGMPGETYKFSPKPEGCRRQGLLGDGDPVDGRGQSAGRVHRRDRRPPEVGLPRRGRGAAVPDRLARALRPGDDRGHGCGAPVVAFRCGSTPEIIEGDSRPVRPALFGHGHGAALSGRLWRPVGATAFCRTIDRRPCGAPARPVELRGPGLR